MLNLKTAVFGWFNTLYDTFIADDQYLMLLEGLKNTIIIMLGAVVVGIVIGGIIAMIKYCGEDVPWMKPLCALCNFYTTVIRGIPVVVLLLAFFFIILKSADGIVVAIVAFGINSSAYVAELIRSGINAVDPGQMEVGRSLGMSRLQAARMIVLPQAVKNILPAIGNEMIALLKETAVAGYVAVLDLTRAGNLIRNNTYDAVNPLLVVALLYLSMVVLMTWMLKKMEQRLTACDHR